MTVRINGKQTDRLEVTDRGLHYGDGLFETMRVSKGRIRFLRDHLKRLLSGCDRLGIAPPPNGQLVREIETAAAQQQTGIAKLIVTRGSGGRGYRPPVEPHTTRILMTRPMPPAPDNLTRAGGVRLGVASTRLARQPGLAGLKHLNRLEQILASAEPGDYDERVMLDTADNVVDGTMMNLFLVADGVLVTPDLSHAGVAGIMRRRVMALGASMHLSRRECEFGLTELERADEVFMCNAVRGIWPVISIADRRVALGPVTRRLADALARRWP